jgi:hypothetical protein
MYTIYLDLDHLWSAASDAAAQRVHLQQSVRITGTTVPVIESEVLLTIPLPHDNVLAAHIGIERADALVDRRLLYEAITTRVSRIVELLSAEAGSVGLIAQPGIALVPGLLDDLKKTDCVTGDRWKITETEHGNPRTRTLTIYKELAQS